MVTFFEAPVKDFQNRRPLVCNSTTKVPSQDFKHFKTVFFPIAASDTSLKWYPNQH